METLSPVTSVESSSAVTSVELPLSPVTLVETPLSPVTSVETPLSPVTSVESSRDVTSVETPLSLVTLVESFTHRQTLHIAKKSMPVCDQPIVDQSVHVLPVAAQMYDRTIR